MKNIAAKLVNIMAECSHVVKAGINDFHGYKYATAADVLEKVGAALVKHKVVAITNPELVRFEKTVNSKGKEENLATVKTTLRLVDSESGETIEACGWGSGQDIGDKAVMKAQTASLKYAWMLLLQISTGDDPEADAGVDERMGGNPQNNQQQNMVTDPQKRKIYSQMKQLNITEEQLLQTIKKDSLDVLTKKQASELISKLDTQLKKGV